MRCLITWLLAGALVVGAGGINAADKAPVPSTEADTRYVEELTNILETTASIDAFVATLRLLEKNKEVNRKHLVPLIIRNAERVGVFGHYIGEDKGSATEMAEMVMECIVKLSKKPSARARAAKQNEVNPVVEKAATRNQPVEMLPWPPEGHFVQDKECRTPIIAPICSDSPAPPCEGAAGVVKDPFLREPIRPDSPAPPCDGEPNEFEVFRALPFEPGIPYLYEKFRANAQVVYERVIDKIDSPRFFPLVGQAQLHHCYWKCTVYFAEVMELTYPLPFRISRPRVEVVYIDKDYLHVYSPATPDQKAQPPSLTDFMGYKY
jgi:hypothetical protein